MPIYEYQCEDCSNEFEDLVLPGKVQIPSCPQCGSERLSRLVSSFGLVGDGDGRGASSACSGCSAKSCSTCGS